MPTEADVVVKGSDVTATPKEVANLLQQALKGTDDQEMKAVLQAQVSKLMPPPAEQDGNHFAADAVKRAAGA